MTPERRAEIQARLEKATKGPWAAIFYYTVGWGIAAGHKWILRIIDNHGTQADANFIAHAPQDIADLLAENERLTDENEQMVNESGYCLGVPQEQRSASCVSKLAISHMQLEADHEMLAARYRQVRHARDAALTKNERLEAALKQQVNDCNNAIGAARDKQAEVERLKAEDIQLRGLCCVCKGNCCQLAKDRKAEVERLTRQLDRARAVMIRAMDALESDSELDARREAFELIQAQWEGVTHADHARAEALLPQLRAVLEQEGGSH